MNLVPVLVALLLLAGLAAAPSEPRTLWTYPAFDKVTGLSLPANVTYVAAQAGALTRLDSNGTVVRSLPVGLIQRFSASVEGSVLATVAGLETTLRDAQFNALWTYTSQAPVQGVAVAAGGERVAVGTADSTLLLLDREGRSAGGRRLKEPMGTLSISDDGWTVAATVPGRLLLFDGELAETGGLDVGSATALTVSGDGSRAALGDADGNLRLVDREGNEKFSLPLDPPGRVAAVALSANGSLLLAAWGADVAAIAPGSKAVLWRKEFIQPVEALGLSRDGARAAVAIRGGLVYALATGFTERVPEALPSALPSAAPPSPPPTPRENLSAPPPPAPPGPSLLPPLAGALAAGGALAVLALLLKQGRLVLPAWPGATERLRALPRRLAAPSKRTGPAAPKRPPAPPTAPPGGWPRAPPVPRTPPLPPGVARLLRERAREEKTLENLDYMKGRGLLDAERHAALREEAVAKLREIRRRLEEAGYRG